MTDTFALDNGIPQGSPLSVVLYNIYANTLARAVEDFPGMDFIGIYADNIFAVSSGSPVEVQSKLINLDLGIQDWANKVGATIPYNKTEILHVCRRRQCHQNFVNFGIETVQVVSRMRILGIIFTKNLLWTEHIALLTSKLGKINNLLRLICSRKKVHIWTLLSTFAELW